MATITTASTSERRPTAGWLRERYERDGDTAIAAELGVARGTVRRWRDLEGIASKPPGRRAAVGIARPVETENALDRLAARYSCERRTGGPPPTEALVAARTVAYRQATLAGDRLAILDAAAGAASAWLLLLDHQLALTRLERMASGPSPADKCCSDL